MRAVGRGGALAPEPGGRVGLSWVPIAVTVVPMLAAVVQLLSTLGSEYSTVSDMATEELHVRELGSHAVLVGPFSRFGWAHPGPAIYYLNWPLYKLLGDSSQSFAVTALVVNGACVVAIALLIRRHFGVGAMVWSLLVLAVYLRTLGGGFLRDGWNPYLPVLPFALFVLLIWAVVQGTTWALVPATLLASFAVQSHVGYAPPIALVVVVAAAALLVKALTGRRAGAAPRSAEQSDPAAGEVPDGVEHVPEPAFAGGHAHAESRPLEGHEPSVSRADVGTPRPAVVGDRSAPGAVRSSPRRGRHWLLPVGASVVLGVIVWLPPLIQQLSHSPGNITLLTHYFRSAKPDWTYSEGLRQLSNALGQLPAYVTGRTPAPVYLRPAILPLWSGGLAAALSVLAAGLAIRARRWALLLLLILGATVAVVGVVSVRQVVGPLFDYLFKWVMVAGILLWIGTGIALLSTLPGSAVRRLGRPALVVALVGLTALSGITAVGSVRAQTPQTDPDHVVAPFADAVAAWMRPHRGDLVRLDFAPSTHNRLVGTPFVGAGLLLAMQKKGLDVRVLKFWQLPYGAHLVSDQDQVRWVVTIAYNDGTSPPPRPGEQVLARAGEYQVYAGPVNAQRNAP